MLNKSYANTAHHSKQFLSEVLQHINEYLQVHKINMTPYHLQTNRLVECFNGTLENLLVKFSNDLLLVYCTSLHKATGNTPFYLLYGHNLYLPVDIASHTIWSSPDDTRTPSEHTGHTSARSPHLRPPESGTSPVVRPEDVQLTVPAEQLSHWRQGLATHVSPALWQDNQAGEDVERAIPSR